MRCVTLVVATLVAACAVCAVGVGARAWEGGVLEGGVGEGWNYHERVGIPAAARVRRLEDALRAGGARAAPPAPPGRAAPPGRVAGGQLSALADHPYSGGLLIMLDNGDTSMCGAALISNSRSLTAAYCWINLNQTPLQLTVVLGSEFLFSGGVRIVTKEVVSHPNYNFVTLANNIALVKHAWVGFNSRIQPIKLPSGAQLSDTFAGATATATGYGISDDAEMITASLPRRAADLEVVGDADCSTQPQQMARLNWMCARGNGTRGTCPGDGGSPLAWRHPDTGEDVLIGISYFYQRTCNLIHPSVYTRITPDVSWILTEM